MTQSVKLFRCRLATAGFFSLCVLFFLTLSYCSVMSVSRDAAWFAPDYWLAWFSAGTLVAAGVSTMIAGMAWFAALDCVADETK